VASIWDEGEQLITFEPVGSQLGITASPSGGLNPAQVSLCGGITTLQLTASDEVIASCGSSHIEVLHGPVEITFYSSEWEEASTSLEANNSLTFDPVDLSFTAPESNDSTVVIMIDGIEFVIDDGATLQLAIEGIITAPTDPIQVNTLVDVYGNIIEVDLFDTHTAVWDWGDGSTSAVTVHEETDTVTGTHGYSEAGVYTLKLKMIDQDKRFRLSIFRYIVIFDPSGGFVTGGGWIWSPAGALVTDPSLTGEANFGFVSKYKKGQSTPDGNTQFQFKAGDLNFHSDNYQWLVVAGARAQFKGTGTINGEGGYGFMLTAIDADLTPSTDMDLFRIKIWDIDTEEVIYDNQIGEAEDADPMTALDGGAIVIHNAK
jgi:hypothetical protein